MVVQFICHLEIRKLLLKNGCLCKKKLKIRVTKNVDLQISDILGNYILARKSGFFIKAAYTLYHEFIIT